MNFSEPCVDGYCKKRMPGRATIYNTLDEVRNACVEDQSCKSFDYIPRRNFGQLCSTTEYIDSDISGYIFCIKGSGKFS